jgi:hypothetical protein
MHGCTSPARNNSALVLREAAVRLLKTRAAVNRTLPARERKTAASIAEERFQDLVEFGDRERT